MPGPQKASFPLHHSFPDLLVHMHTDTHTLTYTQAHTQPCTNAHPRTHTFQLLSPKQEAQSPREGGGVRRRGSRKCPLPLQPSQQSYGRGGNFTLHTFSPPTHANACRWRTPINSLLCVLLHLGGLNIHTWCEVFLRENFLAQLAFDEEGRADGS